MYWWHKAAEKVRQLREFLASSARTTGDMLDEIAWAAAWIENHERAERAFWTESVHAADWRGYTKAVRTFREHVGEHVDELLNLYEYGETDTHSDADPGL